MTALSERLRGYGAPTRDCIDLRVHTDPRVLRYADLIRNAEQPLVDGVVEQQSLALLYVVDHARLIGRDQSDISGLRRILAMRADPAWLGVLRPGRLDFTRLIQDRGERVTRPLAVILELDKPVAPGVSQQASMRAPTRCWPTNPTGANWTVPWPIFTACLDAISRP